MAGCIHACLFLFLFVSADAQIPLFTAGIVLMLNMWAGADAQKQRGQRNTVKEMKEMSDVHRAMDMLKVMEVR